MRGRIKTEHKFTVRTIKQYCRNSKDNSICSVFRVLFWFVRLHIVSMLDVQQYRLILLVTVSVSGYAYAYRTHNRRHRHRHGSEISYLNSSEQRQRWLPLPPSSQEKKYFFHLNWMRCDASKSIQNVHHTTTTTSTTTTTLFGTKAKWENLCRSISNSVWDYKVEKNIFFPFWWIDNPLRNINDRWNSHVFQIEIYYIRFRRWRSSEKKLKQKI